MSEADALLAAIRQAPDDDAPRLIYADWLDEHGQPERAEFIRVQIELARQDSPALRKREAELLAAHHDLFAGPLASAGLRFAFERGFIVRFGHTGLFVRDRLGPNSGSPSCYRFTMAGNCHSCIGVTAQGFVEIYRTHPDLMAERHSYTMDAIQFPAQIQFAWHETMTVTGPLWGSELVLDIYDQEAQRPKSLKRCTHFHIDGFDSFSES